MCGDTGRQAFEAVGEHVHVMAVGEPLGKLGDIAAVAEDAVVVVDHERDAKAAV